MGILAAITSVPTAAGYLGAATPPPTSSELSAPDPAHRSAGTQRPSAAMHRPYGGDILDGRRLRRSSRGWAVAGFIRENPSEPRIRAASRDSGRIRGGAEWSQAPSDAKLESGDRPSGALAAALRAQDDAGKERWGAAMLASLVASTSLAGACG
jgi:hypothetical protein